MINCRQCLIIFTSEIVKIICISINRKCWIELFLLPPFLYLPPFLFPAFVCAKDLFSYVFVISVRPTSLNPLWPQLDWSLRSKGLLLSPRGHRRQVCCWPQPEALLMHCSPISREPQTVSANTVHYSYLVKAGPVREHPQLLFWARILCIEG